jgi:mono/diheme cytochrome c family protein
MHKFKTIGTNLLIFVLFVLAASGCSFDKSNHSDAADPLMAYYGGKGIGPVKEVQLSAIDSAMAAEGEKLFQNKCIACHQATSTKVIGPGLLGITLRRSPEWIMNQILNPMEMTQKDSLAKELLAVYLAQMVKMDVNEKEARMILEFFRVNDVVIVK